MKRFVDIVLSLLGLIVLSPLIIPTLVAIWLQDYQSPFYIAPRVGKNGRDFKMVKLRSMVVNADRSGVDSTKSDDPRITAVGRFVRSYKLDELGQLVNVLKGDMSLVGPRPQVQRDVDLYTDEERLLLSVRPGITDFSSIVFSDEGEILRGSEDPDLRYNQIIRPWKSRLGLFYISHQTNLVDLKLIALTVLAVASRSAALRNVAQLLSNLGADPKLVQVARRESELQPFPPPGAVEIASDTAAV